MVSNDLRLCSFLRLRKQSPKKLKGTDRFVILDYAHLFAHNESIFCTRLASVITCPRGGQRRRDNADDTWLRHCPSGSCIDAPGQSRSSATSNFPSCLPLPFGLVTFRCGLRTGLLRGLPPTPFVTSFLARSSFANQLMENGKALDVAQQVRL